MNQIRRNAKRSWSVASIAVLPGLLLGSLLSGPSRVHAQYSSVPSPYVPTQSPYTYGSSPYGLLAPLYPAPVAQPVSAPAEAAPAVPANVEAVQTIVPATATVEPVATPATVTVEPALIEKTAPSAGSSAAGVGGSPVGYNPSQPPVAEPVAIPVSGPSIGSNSPSPAPVPSATSEPPLDQTQEPPTFRSLVIGKPLAPSMPAPAPEVKKAAEMQPAPEVKRFVESLPVVHPKPVVQHATPVAETQSEGAVVPAVATSVSNPATPETVTDKPAISESAVFVGPPDALQAPADPCKVKDMPAEHPAGAEDSAAVAVAVPQTTPEWASWFSNFSPMQMLLAIVVAIALGTSTGIWAIILLGGRRGGLPTETIELINQTLQVWCDHLANGRAVYGWAPQAGGPGYVPARERESRPAATPLASDVIVQSILKENRNLRTEDEPENDSDTDSAPESESAAPGNRIDKVIWEMKVDDLGTS
ncbi:hypothetical protein AYO44_03120 [Planctomycetaceae bacterium SCGC AG-212-F19]|nr:hypothetical protein AYO44_03120 [Planctomycetaceae bacterium SCGC AG-212-F19]